MQNQNEFPLPDSLAAGRCAKKEGGGSEGGKGRLEVVVDAHVRGTCATCFCFDPLRINSPPPTVPGQKLRMLCARRCCWPFFSGGVAVERGEGRVVGLKCAKA